MSAQPGTTEAEITWTPAEIMSIAAARELAGATSCFVGIGLPSTAANVARRVHNPDLVLIYESGAIGAKPATLPLSIGDGELADTADAVVSVPEIFNYWLQAGRIDVGFLAAAQVDRFGNINTTVVDRGEGKPEARLPGAGGAPEIAAHAGRVLINVQHTRRMFVRDLDFTTTVGHGKGAGDRERLGLPGQGSVCVITDLGILRPDPHTRELTLMSLHPGADLEEVRDRTGWDLRVAGGGNGDIATTPPPAAAELETLRTLQAASQGKESA